MVRPIDIADHMAKTLAAEKVNQIEKAAPEMDQRQFAMHLDGKLIQKQEQAAPPPKTDEVIIHRDNPKREEQKKKKEKKKKQNANHLDVRA